MDTTKILIPKGKGHDPILTPGPQRLVVQINQKDISGTNQPKRYYRGREAIKPRIDCFERRY